MKLVATCIVLSCLSLPLLAQEPVPLGDEFQVNTYTTGPQSLSTVAATSGGRFVVTWSSTTGGGGAPDGSESSVQGRFFSVGGNGQGLEFQVNTETLGNQNGSKVAGDGSGRFVVVWQGVEDGSLGSVQGQPYNSDGSPLGLELQLNSFTAGTQRAPSVAMSPGGSFVATWVSDGQVGVGESIHGQRFDPTGVPLGGEFQVSTVTTLGASEPDVSTDPTGAFVVVWQSSSMDGSDLGIVGQRFDASGVRLGDEFQVNTYTADNQLNPVIQTDSAGNFVVAWTSNAAQDGGGASVHGQRFDATGTSIGGEFQINEETAGNQDTPALAVYPDGSFVVAWVAQDFVDEGIFVRRFDATATPLGGEVQVNTYVTGRQRLPSVTQVGSGEFVVTWTTLVDQDGSSWGIQGRRFVLPENLIFTDGFESGDSLAWDSSVGG